MVLCDRRHIQKPAQPGRPLLHLAVIANSASAGGYIASVCASRRLQQHADVVHLTTDQTDMASTLPNTKRIDGYTVEFSRPTFLEAHSMAYNVFQLAARGRASGD